MRKVKVAATQMAASWNIDDNILQAEKMVRKAASKGAQIILLQELFETPYFCQKQKPDFFAFAHSAEDSKTLRLFTALARELQVVLPISFFEKAGTAYYNSVAMIDADGSIMGFYRKTHIPDGPGYQEKYYFNPGDLGLKVWQTRYARIGLGICWDQWFPELARSLVLQGAELLLYPTAIGSEPQDADLDSRDHWQLVMRGHAGANLCPVIASNRIGREVIDDSTISFYGSSFMTDEKGGMVQEADRQSETILVHEYNLDNIEKARASWGVFRDRRPDIYSKLLTLDGEHLHSSYRGTAQ